MNILTDNEYHVTASLESVYTERQTVESSDSTEDKHKKLPPEYNSKLSKILKEIPLRLETRHFLIDTDMSNTVSGLTGTNNITLTAVNFKLFDELLDGTSYSARKANSVFLKNRSLEVLQQIYPESDPGKIDYWNDFKNNGDSKWLQNKWIPTGFRSSNGYETVLDPSIITPAYYPIGTSDTNYPISYPYTVNATSIYPYSERYRNVYGGDEVNHFENYKNTKRLHSKYQRVILTSYQGYKVPVSSHTIKLSDNEYITCLTSTFTHSYRQEQEGKSVISREKDGFVRSKTPICFIESVNINGISLPVKIHKVVNLDGSDFDCDGELVFDSDLAGQSPTHVTEYRLDTLSINVSVITKVMTVLENNISVELPYKKNTRVSGKLGIIHDRFLEQLSHDIVTSGLQDAIVTLNELKIPGKTIFEIYQVAGRCIDSIIELVNSDNIWIFELLYPNFIEDLTNILNTNTRISRSYERVIEKLNTLGYTKPIGQLVTKSNKLIFSTTEYRTEDNIVLSYDYIDGITTLVDYLRYDRRVIDYNIDNERISDRNEFYDTVTPIPGQDFIQTYKKVSHTNRNGSFSEFMFKYCKLQVNSDYQGLEKLKSDIDSIKYTRVTPYTFIDESGARVNQFNVIRNTKSTVKGTKTVNDMVHNERTFEFVSQSDNFKVRSLVFKAGVSWFYVKLDKVITLNKFEKITIGVNFDETFIRE